MKPGSINLDSPLIQHFEIEPDGMLTLLVGKSGFESIIDGYCTPLSLAFSMLHLIYESRPLIGNLDFSHIFLVISGQFIIVLPAIYVVLGRDLVSTSFIA